jgi:hypothetical protein
MSATAATFIHSFEELSPHDRQVILETLLSRFATEIWGDITSNDALQIAEERFLEMDREEAQYEART